MNKKLIIFDLDGTLVDTASDIASAVNMMLEHYGLPIHSEDNVRKMIGKGAKNLIFQALPSTHRGEEALNEALEYYRGCYDRNLIVKTHVYSGIRDVLCELKDRGVQMAILSNKDERQVKTIADTLLPNMFVSVNGFTIKFPHKPAPDAVYDIIDRYGANKDDVAFVGDSSIDVITAKNAGVLSVGVTWGFAGEAAFDLAAPDVVVTSPEQLLGIIE